MSISKKNAYDLAVAYSAYTRADTDNGTIVWGGLLIDAQRKTGVVLRSEAKIRDHVENARAREDRAASRQEAFR